MDRRLALRGIAGIAATGAVLAGIRQAAAQGSMTESSYRQNTLLAATFAKQTSELAIQRASNRWVKQFAQIEANEQMTIAQVLTNEANPPPVPLDQPRQSVMTALTQQNGAAFDQAYVAGQIAGHEDLYRIQQTFLDSRPTSYGLQHIAMLARTSIQSHLLVLRELQQQLTA